MLKKHIHYCVDKNKGIPSTLLYEGLPLSNAIRVLMVLLKGNKILHLITLAIWRRHPDLNRGIGVLQTRALPLGYVAVYKNGAIFQAPHLERMTRLELATSTLARLRSTR